MFCRILLALFCVFLPLKLMANGDFVSPSFSESTIASMEKKCSSGRYSACVDLLKMPSRYPEGYEGELSFLEIRDYLIKRLDTSCKIDYKACLSLANMYDEDERLYEILEDELDSDQPLDEAKKFIFLGTLRDTGLETSNSLRDSYIDKASSLMETACYAGLAQRDVRACFRLAALYENAYGIPLNRPKAMRIREFGIDSLLRECLLENNSSCDMLGKQDGYLGQISSDIENLIRKCDERDATSCFKASLYHTQGFYNSNRARGYFKRDLNDDYPQETQEEVKDDKSKATVAGFVKAAGFLKRACRLEPDSCFGLFGLSNARACLEKGDLKACAIVPVFKPEFLALACEGGDVASCYGLRNIQEFDNDKNFIFLAQRACKGGVAKACYELSRRYKVGYKITQSDEKSIQYVQRACKWEMKAYELNPDLKPNENACYEAGLAYEIGGAVKQDLASAIKTYEYSCKFNKASCVRLANLIEGEKPLEALELYKNACNTRRDACAGAAKLYFSLATKASPRALEYLDLAMHYISKFFVTITIHDGLGISGGEELFIDADVHRLNAEIFSMEKIKVGRPDGKSTSVDNPYKTYAIALSNYEMACNDGLSESCAKKEQYLQEVATKINGKCDFDNPKSTPEACYQVAIYDGLFASKAKAYKGGGSYDFKLEWLIASCAAGVSKACTALLNLDASGTYEYILEENPITTLEDLNERLCNAKPQDIFVKARAFRDTTAYEIADRKKNACYAAAKIMHAKGNHAGVVRILEPTLDGDGHQEYIGNARLEWLAKAYFELGRYDKMKDAYRLIYKEGCEEDCKDSMQKSPGYSSYHYLAKAYEAGLGVTQSYEKAAEIYKLGVLDDADKGRSCVVKRGPRGYASSYLGLAELYEKGLGVVRDSRMADKLLMDACPLDRHKVCDEEDISPRACALLSVKLADENNDDYVLYKERACEIGYKGELFDCNAK